MKIIGVIPARKGSQGIKNKNMIDICGKHLIEYTFTEAIHSKLDEIILTTDDINIINLAKERYEDIIVPFQRPEELSGSDTEAIDVALHLLQKYESLKGYMPDAVCWLQPTSPLRTAEDIDNCISIMNSKEVDSVISIADVQGSNPYKMKSINSDGYLEDLLKLNNKSTNRQKLPKVYIPNGAIFMTKTGTLLDNKNFFGNLSLPYEMTEENSVNIDTLFDAKIANIILEKRNMDEI